jgi:hypothetical protein
VCESWCVVTGNSASFLDYNLVKVKRSFLHMPSIEIQHKYAYKKMHFAPKFIDTNVG